MARKTSAAGRAAIMQREGCKLKAFFDTAWTIGCGHTGRASSPVVVPGMKITKAQAEQFLDSDLAAIESEVDALLKFEPTQNQFDAMISLAHNIGLGKNRFSTSTVVHRFNADDMQGAADAFLLWNKQHNPKTGVLEVSNGLTNRRKAELLQFMTPDVPSLAPVQTGPIIEAATPLLPPAAPVLVTGADLGFWARGIKALAWWWFDIPITEN